MTVGLLQGLANAIADADDSIGGTRATKLTANFKTAVLVDTGSKSSSSGDGIVITFVPTLDAAVIAGQRLTVLTGAQAGQSAVILTVDGPNQVTLTGTGVGAAFTSETWKIETEPDTTASVENAAEWDATGSVYIEGVKYAYTAKTATSLTIPTGATQLHPTGKEVLDYTRTFSALDLVRRGFLVDLAEGEDLRILARNLGVEVPVFMLDDEDFRRAVKALAYNPKGTIYGIELALDAYLGAGNYVILEDFTNYPATVIIGVNPSAFAVSGSTGRAFLANRETDGPASTTTVDTQGAITSVGGVRLAPQDHTTDASQAKPSADLLTEYTGQTPFAPWAYEGPSEAADAIVNAGGFTRITDGSGADVAGYAYDVARIHADSVGLLSVVLQVPTASTIGAAGTDGNQIRIQMVDVQRSMAAGVIDAGAGNIDIGFVNTGTGAFIGSTITVARDVFHDVTIRKVSDAVIELYVDGTLVSTQAKTAFAALGSRRLSFGCFDTAKTGVIVDIKSVHWALEHPTDYWNARFAGGTTVVSDRLTLGVAQAQAGDVGKFIRITGGATNPQGGNAADGLWKVAAYVSTTQLDLEGELKDEAALPGGGTPKRIVLPAGHELRYPLDLGKKIEVLNSDTPANDGTYTIEKMFDGAGTDLSTLLSPPDQLVSVIEVLEPVTFVTDAAVDWRLVPDFLGNAVSWELFDAGSFTGTTLTLRQPIPILDTVEIMYSQVLSAQALEDVDVLNVGDSYYPFYLSDPTGQVSEFVDGLTVAGVIPEVFLTLTP